MNPEETAIVAEIGNSVMALNAALEKAYNSRLDVKLDYVSVQRIDRVGDRKMYFADVSKQAFNKRVG